MMVFYLFTVVAFFIFPACVTSLGVSPHYWPLVTETQSSSSSQAEHADATSFLDLRSEMGLRRHVGSQPLQIHILSKNRPTYLQSLLTDLSQTNFNGDTIILNIHCDGCDPSCRNVFENIKSWWPFSSAGSDSKKILTCTEKSRGLALAWLNAWIPSSDDEWATILEDDLRLSPSWYKWLQLAYITYGSRDLYAGASLQRQSLMPVIPHKVYKQGVYRDIKTNIGKSGMFFYPLCGSQGFAPKASVWRKFVSWFNLVFSDGNNLKAIDISILKNVRPLVSGKWWKSLPPSGMWTQYFIYFSSELHLYTLYYHLPPRQKAQIQIQIQQNKQQQLQKQIEWPALVSHMRAQGEHFKGAEAGKPDNPVEYGYINMNMPPNLPILGWEASPYGISSPEGVLIDGKLVNQFFGYNNTY